MIVAKEAGIKRKEAKDKAQRLLNEIGLNSLCALSLASLRFIPASLATIINCSLTVR
jgi:DNA repair protein RadC